MSRVLVCARESDKDRAEVEERGRREVKERGRRSRDGQSGRERREGGREGGTDGRTDGVREGGRERGAAGAGMLVDGWSLGARHAGRWEWLTVM